MKKPMVYDDAMKYVNDNEFVVLIPGVEESSGRPIVWMARVSSPLDLDLWNKNWKERTRTITKLVRLAREGIEDEP